ncbi:MucBP domain-containing protein [Lactococcus petauri]|uniref:MucBP domain-containing protein n=1 Tax=Lactococcus petauri TaxID=1940789 RepID=UPI00254AB915|nr:MucBP domain-containing protein [Lactococcus petauri]
MKNYIKNQEKRISFYSLFRDMKKIHIAVLLFIGAVLLFPSIIAQAQASAYINANTSYAQSRYQSEPIDDSGNRPLVWSLRVNKDNPENISVKTTTLTEDSFTVNDYIDGFVLTNYAKLASVPTVSLSSSNLYKIQYSIDGVTFTDSAPANLELVKAFNVVVEGTVPRKTSIVTTFSVKPIMEVIPDNKGVVAVKHTYKYSSSTYEWSPLYFSPFTDKAADLTVIYQDENGKELHAPQTISGKLGEAYDTTTSQYQPSIDGYTLDESKLPTNAKGTLSDQAQTVTYVYTKNPVKAADVTVNYVDEDGNAIPSVSPQTISGNVGGSYDATTDIYKLTIDGYSLDESKLPTNAKGTLSDQAQTVTYVYTKNPVKAADVTVNYVDEDGNAIPSVSPQTISGNVGGSYDATTDVYKLTIDGYTLDESKFPTNAKGTLSEQAQTVTYVYTKNKIPNITGIVLAKYVDIDGNKISEDIVKSGTVGEGYSTEKKDIKGYTFKEVQGSTTGQFTEQVQTVTYVYTKNKVNPVNPEPKPENKPSSNDKNKNQGTISSTQHDLPATGENERIAMMHIILGLILLALGVVVSIFRFKKVNK